MLKLELDNETGTADLARDGGNLEMDEGLKTAVVISLFTDARARDDDPRAGAEDDRRGWWGDTYAEPAGDRIGSRLWLLRRGKTQRETLQQAKAYAEDALEWLVLDGVAKSVQVTAERVRPGILSLQVAISRPDPPASRWHGAWEVHSNAV